MSTHPPHPPSSRIAVVGSGPAGFYVADALLHAHHPLRVDMYERLPTPYGLVRGGVAPDAQSTKQIIRFFEKVAARPGFRFLGNVQVGRDLTVEELRGHYTAVVIATGAQAHRRLGIPGEDLPGSLTANEFTGWYNGHPDYHGLRPGLDVESVTIVGQGNVAMDVARMLAKQRAHLQDSDAPEEVLKALDASRIRRIQIVGRRGPAQAAFTYPELQSLIDLPHCSVFVPAEDLELNQASEKELVDPQFHNHRRNVELLKLAAARAAPAERTLAFLFLRKPLALEGEGRVRALRVEKGRLEGEPGSQRFVGTGQIERIPCGLVIRCVGYTGTEIPGLPFDHENGVIPNAGGRVLDRGTPLAGVYAAGWIRHGAVGLIGTTKRESKAVVEKILEDLPKLAPPVPSEDPLARLQARGVRVVSFEQWRALDARELERGRAINKPREKLRTWDELLGSDE